jgi:ABC-2 type transport system permease protein
MSWSQIARKDFQDAIRARWLWILTGVMILAFAYPVLLEYYLGGSQLPVAEFVKEDPTVLFASFGRVQAMRVVSVLTLVMSYAAITRERSSGSIKVLLSLPHARRDIVVGKFLGRSFAVLVSILLSLGLTAVLLAGIGGLNVTNFTAFSLFTLLLAVPIAALGVGLSALMDTTRRAILASIVALALFLAFWTAPVVGIFVSIFGVDPATASGYTIQHAITLLNPLEAYKDLVAPYMVQSTVAEGYPAESGTVPIVLRAPFSILVMIAWTVVSLVVGVWHFERADL